MTARPFLKWAGGKTQLLPELMKVFPEKVRTYYEPFLGGGAVFWALSAQGRFETAVLNDWNEELVNAYRVVRDEPDALIECLLEIKANYDSDPRGVFESERSLDVKSFPNLRLAAHTIFLNKTCFNGLYRVNRTGKFNTPFGKYDNPPICDAENLLACSRVLAGSRISVGDFSLVCDAGKGDLVYFDPPYDPVTKTADFTGYTSSGFGVVDQKRLADIFHFLVDSGATVVLSNSDTPLMRELYDGFDVRTVRARRSVNSKATARGPVNEILVVGGRTPEAPRGLSLDPDWSTLQDP